MSSQIAKMSRNEPNADYLIEPPRSSDTISGALRAAFGYHADPSDDFSALLRQIDDAECDRNSGR